MNRSANADRARLAGARALALAAVLSACDDEPRGPGAAPPPPPAEATTGVATPPTSEAAPPAPSTTAVSLAGTWEGTYDAKKGSIELPSKLKDKVRHKDDGTASAGPGTVSLTVAPDGELRGKAKGALGDATLVGKSEDEMIRASVFPDDPLSPHAMTGILVGKLKDGVIHAEIRVTGPDATLVRESPVELTRK